MTVASIAANLPALARRFGRFATDGWTLGALLLAALVAVPVAAVIWLAIAPGDDIWKHLASTVLPYYVRTTLILMLGVGVALSSSAPARRGW